MSHEVPHLLDALRARAGSRDWLRFDEFMDLALFAPEVGYYQRNHRRVGLTPEADFYTATSAGPLFGELVCAATTRLLADTPLADYTFVEIGAEPDPQQPDQPSGILRGVTHPFKAVRTLRLGDTLTLEGPIIVFSNELFDAQPCRRFVFRDGSWRELGVSLVGQPLSEIELPSATLPPQLPNAAPEGYHLDLPLASVDLCRQLASQPWHGLFLTFDYGKSWEELRGHTPQGTVRAYHKHKQSNDLLAQPGEQDLTCHVCWDWLATTLTETGFKAPTLESQEAFLIHNAGETIAATMAAEATRASARKMALMQLLHPANMGQRFQVLHAVRTQT